MLDRDELQEIHLGFRGYQQYKQNKIRDHFSGYTFVDYERFFELCTEIQTDLDTDHKKWSLGIAVRSVLIALSERDPILYVRVIDYYLSLTDPLNLDGIIPLTEKLIEICGPDRAFEMLNSRNYSTKQSWLFGYYQSLPAQHVTKQRLFELYELYRVSRKISNDLDFLLKYRSLDERVVAKVTRLILDKRQGHSEYALGPLFNPFTEVNKVISDLFSQDLDILKDAYFASIENDRNEDWDGLTFNRILDLYPGFISEYVDQI